MKEPEVNLLEQYKYIVDETNIVSKSDLQGKITFANRKFAESSGYALEELLGRPHSILRNPDTHSDVFKELWNTIQSKKIWRGVLKNIKKDGTFYIVEASIYPIINEEGNIVEYISIRYDITELKELYHKIELLHKYDTLQQKIAKEKLEAVIVNELEPQESQVIYHPSDILSGDAYSIFKRNDGSIFIYIIDGQGHGMSPALTIFAVSATIKQLIGRYDNLEKICKNLFPTIRTFLGEIEQLSYTMLLISSNREKLSYSAGGMYPFLVKKSSKVMSTKANNLPFMEFSPIPIVDELDISGWESLMLYSDGLVEHENSDKDYFLPEKLIENPILIDCISDLLQNYEVEDDITLVNINNRLNSITK